MHRCGENIVLIGKRMGQTEEALHLMPSPVKAKNLMGRYRRLDAESATIASSFDGKADGPCVAGNRCSRIMCDAIVAFGE
jgi:hypothetical protein